jgi:hypothetical protein
VLGVVSVGSAVGMLDSGVPGGAVGGNGTGRMVLGAKPDRAGIALAIMTISNRPTTHKDLNVGGKGEAGEAGLELC